MSNFHKLCLTCAFGLTAISGNALADRPTLPRVPAGSDSIWYLGQVSTIAEPSAVTNPGTTDSFGNTGIATTSPDGTGVTLYDHDFSGTESGNPNQSDSDYIYAFAGFIYFDSDSETTYPSLTHTVDTANFARLQETGNWQQIDQYFTGLQGPLYVASDVPEPASWALMFMGVAGLGATLRWRRVATKAVMTA